MKWHGFKLFSTLALALSALPAVQAQSPIDPALPVYPRVEHLQGKLNLVGSSTLSQLAAIWGDSFKQLYPQVDINVAVKGSANAVTSVIDGQASFGMLSRSITEAEVKAFHDKFGYLPTVLTPAMEPIAIFVHKDNPVSSLTLTQLDAIFSTTLKRGAPKTAANWGDLGLAGQWATTPIVCEIRNDETGSQVFFQQVILGNGSFRESASHHGNNLEMVKSIATNPKAIGFAGAIYATPDVKAVPLAWRDGDTALDIHDPRYPLVRPLQIVVNRPPHAQLPALDGEFIKFIFSKRGQQDVIIGGFTPITARPAQIALDAAGLNTLN